LVENKNSNFNEIFRKIIKKSLFTERQIEIILKRKNKLEKPDPTISRGAYYRQVNQCRNKLISFYYSVILLQDLGIIHPNDFSVISRLVEQVSVIKSSDVFPERQEQVVDLIDKVLRKTCGM